MAFSWDSKNVRGVYVEGVEVVNYTHLRGLKFCTCTRKVTIFFGLCLFSTRIAKWIKYSKNLDFIPKMSHTQLSVLLL